MNANHFVGLFRYTRWADEKVIAALREAASGAEADPLRRARALLSHALRAQAVWLGRIQRSDDARLPFWETDSLDECARRSAANAEAWTRFLEKQSPADLEKEIRYQNSKGRVFTTALHEIAAHVVNHSTHHRAQAALFLREAALEPPATDYIFYARAAAPERDVRLA